MKFIRLVFIFVALFMMAGCSHIPVEPPVVSSPLVIDVRTELEWQGGHLQGAVLIPHDRIEQGIGAVAPDKDKKIYLYCRSGRRTGIAFDALKRLGYTDLVNLETLEKASRELNLPIVK